MKRAIIFLLISFTGFLTCETASAQSQQKIDSLKQLLLSNSHDTIKIKQYKHLSWEYAITRIKTDSARMYADSISTIAEQLNSDKEKARSHFYYGVIDRFEGNYRSAIDHLTKYVNYNVDIGNAHGEVTGLFQIGAIYNNLGNYEESLEVHQRVLSIHRKNKYWFGVGFTLNGIGVIQRSIGNYQKAIDYYEEAYAIFDSLDIKEDKAVVLTNLGNVYGDMSNYNKSLDYHLRSLNIDKELEYEDGIANSLENIGTTYSKLGNYELALKYQHQALDILEKTPQKRIIAINYRKIGEAYFKLKDYKIAEGYFKRSQELAEKINSKPVLRDTYKALHELYAETSNFKNAYNYQQRHLMLNDSILNELSAKQINELQVKYEASEKDKEITLLTKETELQEKETLRQKTIKNVIFIGLLMALFSAGLLYYIFRQKIKNQKLLAFKNNQLTEVNYKQQLGDLEMKALRAQMNPHFLFNCLNSINRMILSGDMEEASRYLTKFSNLIRKVLENSEKNIVPLSDELETIQAYIQLEILRFKGKINYCTNIDKSIDQDAVYIPSMVLQPLIENAIWHGLLHKKNGGTIELSIQKGHNVLMCSVKDDGVGRKNSKASNHTFMKQKSMGLHLTNKRLQILGELGEEHIKIIDLKDNNNQAIGTQVDLLIPIAS